MLRRLTLINKAVTKIINPLYSMQFDKNITGVITKFIKHKKLYDITSMLKILLWLFHSSGSVTKNIIKSKIVTSVLPLFKPHGDTSRFSFNHLLDFPDFVKYM